MGEGAKGTPASLGDLLMERQRASEIERQTQLDEAQREERHAKNRFVGEVRRSDEYTDIEKTGWLLAVDSEDPESAAEGFIDKLLRVEELVSRHDTLLVYVRFSLGRAAGMFRTDGSGVRLYMGSAYCKIGVKEREHGFISLSGLNESTLATAVTEPEEVEGLDITAHHNGTYSGDHKDVLIVGGEPIKAYFEKLLDKEEEWGVRLQSQWIEDLLMQIPGDTKDFLSDNERLIRWYEEIRASRVNLAAEHLLSQQSNFYPLPNTSPEHIQRLTDFYGIDYEEALAKALIMHEESAAEIRRRLEAAQPPLVTDRDKSRFERRR